MIFEILGKGVAALTFDKDYQKKRQEIMNQQPTNIPAGLAQGGRGFVLVIIFFVKCTIYFIVNHVLKQDNSALQYHHLKYLFYPLFSNLKIL